MNIIIENKKAIYIQITKVACTSIRFSLGKMMDIEVTDENVHNNIFPLVHDLKFFNYSDYFKFGFVRNPFDRLVSCYKHKIMKDPNYTDIYYINGIQRGFENYGLFKAGMSFEDFVTAISSIPDDIAEPHFQSQYVHLVDKKGRLMVDYIGRFESLEEDFNFILRKFNANHLQLQHKQQSNPNTYLNYYNDKKVIQMVSERYKRDLDLLGYKINGILNSNQTVFSKIERINIINKELNISKDLLRVIRQPLLNKLEVNLTQRSKKIDFISKFLIFSKKVIVKYYKILDGLITKIKSIKNAYFTSFIN